MNEAEMSSTTTTSVGLVAPNDPRISSHFMRPLASSSPRATVRLAPHSSNGVGEPPAKSPKTHVSAREGTGDNDEVEFIGQLVATSSGPATPAPVSSPKSGATSQAKTWSTGSPQVTTAAQAALAQQMGNGNRPTLRMKSRPKKNALNSSSTSVLAAAVAASAAVSASAPTTTTTTTTGPSTITSSDSVPVEAAGSSRASNAETGTVGSKVVASSSPQATLDSNKSSAAKAEPVTPSEPAVAPAAAAAVVVAATPAAATATPQKRHEQQQQQLSSAVVASNSSNNNNITSTSNGRSSLAAQTTASSNNNPNNNTTISSSPRTPTQPAQTSTATNNNTSNNMAPQPFDWTKYLNLLPAPVAPADAFMQHQELLENKFELGMKLIAKDPRNSSSWCLASVVNVLGLRVRLRFDGSDSMNDFFELVDSESIRPYGSSPDQLLYPPVAYKGNMSTYSKFVEKQLLKPEVRLAPSDIFVPPPKRPDHNLFQCGMKLEAIDRKNAFLICPATVGEVQGDDIKILFDGWRGSFDYSCKYYSREIFPVNWCHRTNHAISPPNNWDALLLGNGSDSASSKKISPNKSHNNSTKTSPPTPKDAKLALQSNHKPPQQHPSSHQKQTPTQPVNSKPPHLKQQQHQTQHQLLDLDDLPKYSCQRAVPYCEWLKTKQAVSQVTNEDDSLTVSESTSFASTFASNTTQQKISPNNQAPSQPELSSSTTSAQSSPEHETRPTRGRPNKKLKVDLQMRQQPQQQLNQSQATSPVPPPQPTPISTPQTTQKELNTNLQQRQMKPDSACRGCSGFVSSVEDVVDLIDSDESLAKYSNIFQQHEIDGKAFCLLTTDIMVNHLGLKIGPVLKINSLIEQVKCHHKRTPSNINQSM